MTRLAGFVMGAAFVVGMATGCARAPAPIAATPQAHPHTHNASDHNHARGHMLMASDGTTEALLTAHLSSKTGNELDVFVERKGRPFAVAATTMTALAKTAAGEDKRIAFECAPRDERPSNEPDDVCSHFVAKAPWMKTGEMLLVKADLPVSERKDASTFVWREFEAHRYAHHVE